MKNKIQYMIQSIAILLVFTMLFSLIFATLYYLNVISTKTFHIVNWIGGILSYAAGGFWLGKNTEKKALLNASFLAIVLAIPTLLLATHTPFGIMEALSKLMIFVLISVLMFMKKRPN